MKKADAGFRVHHAGGLLLGWCDGLFVDGLGGRWRATDEGWEASPIDHPLWAMGGEHHQLAELGEGYVYASHRAVGVLRSGERFFAHPSGAWAAGDGHIRVVAAPGRSECSLPYPIVIPTLRFSPDGAHAFGLDDDQRGVVVATSTGRCTQVDGWPLASDVRWHDDTLWKGPHRLRADIRSATPARSGHLLAGPGGRIWDLATARPLSAPGTILLGATCPLRSGGFATVDWTSHRGWSVGADGQVYDPFSLDIDVDDLVVALIDGPDGLHAHTAEGHHLHVPTGHALPPSDDLMGVEGGKVHTPRGVMEDADEAVVGERHYAWSEDGWLASWPVSIS